jgi:predicted Fe-Mo cluster-binding NifX family protein
LRPDEEADGTLIEQSKSYEVDMIIWLQPGRSSFETLLRLSDMGIRVIAISQVGTPSIPSRYFVWRERAIETLLRDWKNQNSVRKITVVDSQEYRSVVTEEVLRVMLQNLKIESDNRTFQSEDAGMFLRDLLHHKTDGVIFPSAGLASMFAFRNAQELTDLLATHRTAFVDGPIDMPFCKIPDVSVDLVTVNWQVLAESVVNDLITREAFERNRYTTFEADVHFNVPLSNFCDEMRPSRGIAASV